MLPRERRSCGGDETRAQHGQFCSFFVCFHCRCMASFDAPFHNFLGMRFGKRQTFFKKFLPFLDFHSEEILDRRVCRFAPWPSGRGAFHSRKRKGTIGNEPRVVNRLRVVNSLVEEKGRGKENFPLDPLKRKGEGKRTRPGFLRNQLFQDRARAREAKASVRVFFLRGGRGIAANPHQIFDGHLTA